MKMTMNVILSVFTLERHVAYYYVSSKENTWYHFIEAKLLIDLRYFGVIVAYKEVLLLSLFEYTTDSG